MAIIKTSNKSTMSHGAMRNCIDYVLKDKKITDRLVYVTGPAPEEINGKSVYAAFVDEKKIWGKDSGRMYNHNILSFHKDEIITPEQALQFGKCFAENWFKGHQTLVAVHQDRDHIHIHMVTNSVSYYDGKKLHNTKHDLQRMKEFINAMCKEWGLSIAKKGYHFDGTKMDPGEMIAWKKDKYQLIKDDRKNSYIVDCGIAVIEAKEKSRNKEEFVREMENRGWHTTWTDTKEHIVFENKNGEKVSDTNLSNTFSMEINKEAILNEFERQNDIKARRKAKRDRENARKRAEELERYYREVEGAVGGLEDGNSNGAEGSSLDGGQEGRSGEDVGAFVRDIDVEEQNIGNTVETSVRHSKNERRIIGRAENESVISEQQSVAYAEQRRLEEQSRRDDQRRRRESEEEYHGIER